MKTKVFIVPTLIVVSGFVSLHYIKPNLDVYMQKRAERDAAREHAAQAESIAKNVGALTGELETQKEKMSFVKRYLPEEKDEARMFDSVNFLTGQAGLITSRIQIQKVDDELGGAEESQTFAESIDPAATGEAQAALDPGTGLPMAALLPGSVYKAPSIKKYALSLEALGGYSNIRDLLKKLEGFDRLQQLQSFKIAVSEGTSGSAEEGGSGATGTLTLTYTATLPFQKKPELVTGESIVNIPGLKQSTFNLAVLEEAQAKVTDTVPDTVLGTEGKANPFE